MARAHNLDCKTETADRRFPIQSGNGAEAIDPATNHMREVHGQDYSDEELREEHHGVV